MADFPSGPGLTVGQLFTSGWSTWMWDGVKWMASVPSGGVYEPVFGGTQYPMYGFLYNKTVGDPGYSAWAGFGAHRWRFGISPGDDFAAGSIDYRGYASDALNIVGAGTASGNRKINLFDNVNVTGNLTVVGTSVLDGITNTGAINSTGSLTIAGAISSTGSTAILTFQDRAGTTNWGWYAQGGIARLWNDQSGDRVTFDSGGSISTPGNIRTGSNIYMGGQALYFSGVTAGGPIVYGDSTNMTTQLGTGNGAFKWYSNPGAELMTLAGSGPLQVNSEIHSSGSVASLWFQDRGGAFSWAWYADSNVARLYNTYGGTGRVVANVDVNGQASFAQGVYGAAFAINGTGHYIYDALSGHLGFRAGGAAGPYGYASLGADSSWTCGDIHANNIFAPNFLINDGSAATAGTVGFLSGNGPGLQFWGNTSGGAGSVIFLNGSGGLLIKSDSVGNFTTAGTINVGSGVIELGQGRGGDGYAYVDFHAQAGTDYDFRIIRNPGANGGASIVQNGSAPLTFAAPSFSFNNTINSQRIYIQGVSGNDSLVIYRNAQTAYLTLVPEYAANQALIGYYVPGTGWGSLNLAGSVYLGTVYTGDVHCNTVFAANYICFNGNTNGGIGPTLYVDGTNFVIKVGPSNGGLYIQNNAATINAHWFTVDGNAYHNAGLTTASSITANSGTFLKKGGGPSYRMSPNADASGIGSMWYTDPSNMYLLLTAVNDAWGTWNGLRPFTVALASGNVTLGHRVDVSGGLYANAGIAVTGGFTSNGGSTFNGAVTVNGGTDLNGYLNVNNGNNLGVSGNITSWGGQIVLYNSNSNGFYVANANGDHLQIFDDGNPHIESGGSQLWINNNTGAATYFGGPINVYDFYSRNNVNCAGSIGMSGPYLYFGGYGNGSVNGAGGPLIYCDGNNNIIKLGNGGSPAFRVRRYDAVDLFTVDAGGSLGCPGNFTCQGSIYTNSVVMNNACILYGRDTAANAQWLITLWSDNSIYVGDNSRTLHLRGSVNVFDNQIQCPTITVGGLLWQNYNSGWWWTGSPIHTDSAIQANAWITAGTDISAGGQLSCSGNLNVSGTSYLNGNQTRVHGTNANDSLTVTSSDYSKFLTVKPETQGNWCQIGYYCGSGIGWGTTEFVGQCYFDNNINCGDFYSRGNMNTAGSVYCNGLQFWNNGGTWWTPNNIHADGYMQCGDFYVGGCRMYNNSGYMYFDQTLHAAGVYSRGDIWNAGNITAGNDCTANGVFRGSGNGGARIGNWQGSGWDWMAFAIISGGYLGVSPDQGASGFNYTPNASWSDARLKLNIRASEIDALAVIGAIPVRAFDWTEKGRELMPRDVSSVSCGLVAQELEELIPDAVTLVPVIGDLAGDPMRCIIHEQLDAYYIRAFQQLTARIEELEELVRNPPERNLA